MDDMTRDALEKIIVEYDNLSDDSAYSMKEIAREALALLSAPVASDAREQSREQVRWIRSWTPDKDWPAKGAAVFRFDRTINEAAERLERYVAERERKTREEEREACAERAIAYCRQFDGFFEGEDDIQLRAAIMEAGK